MFRRLLLSTVYRNVADAAGGGAPKPEDVPVVAAVADTAPAVPDAAAAAPAPEPVVDAAAAVEPAPVVEPKADAKDFSVETVLTGEEKPADAKPEAPTEAPKGDAKPAADAAKPAEAVEPGKDLAKDGDKTAAPEPPKEAPVYKYEFPEGLKVDDEALKPVNETFAKHGISPEVAKDLMGLHVTQMQAYAASVVAETSQHQRDVWADTRKLWRDEGKGDEQIGGAGYETTLRQAAEVRDRLVPKERMAAFNRMMLVTGVGDHPEFLRLMRDAHRYVGEPAMQTQGGNPPKTNGQPGGRRRIRDTYKTA